MTTDYQPFTADDYVDAAYALELPENAVQQRTRARASSVGSCSRQQAYSYAGVTPSNPQRSDDYRRNGVLTAEQGRYIEDMSCDIIDLMPQGITVVNRQIEVPDGYPVSGHPDGEIVLKGGGPMPDGLKWGFEHKHLGRFSYMKTFKMGFDAANAGYMAQVILYGHALGWDKTIICVLGQDASGNQSEYNRSHNAKKQTPQNSWAQRLDWNSKVQIFAIDLRPWYGFIPQLHDRARQLALVTTQSGAGSIRREGDGIAKNMKSNSPAFPCGYCDYVDRCNVDGNGTEGIVALPGQLGAS
jgi:hypothetical protein